MPEFEDGVMCIPLSAGNHALIDAADYPAIAKHRWKTQRGPGGKIYAGACHYCTRMHRLIMGATPGQLIDHRNGDGLDNRRANLRVASVSQNKANSRIRKDSSQPFKGIEQTRTGRWTAQVKFQGKRYRTATFATALEAAKAYDALAREYHGEFARVNFPEAAALIESRAEDWLAPATFRRCA